MHAFRVSKSPSTLISLRNYAVAGKKALHCHRRVLLKPVFRVLTVYYIRILSHRGNENSVGTDVSFYYKQSFTICKVMIMGSIVIDACDSITILSTACLEQRDCDTKTLAELLVPPHFIKELYLYDGNLYRLFTVCTRLSWKRSGHC